MALFPLKLHFQTTKKSCKINQRRKVNKHCHGADKEQTEVTGETPPPSFQTSWPSSAGVLLARVAMEAQLPVLAPTRPYRRIGTACNSLCCVERTPATPREDDPQTGDITFVDFVSSRVSTSPRLSLQRASRHGKNDFRLSTVQFCASCKNAI